MLLLKAFFNTSAIVEGIDSQSDKVDAESPDTLIYENLFPYLRIPDTTTKADTYIMVAVDAVNIHKNRTYADYRITIWVLAHQHRMRMEGRSATRIDYLSDEIKKVLDRDLQYGFNKLELVANREIILNDKYLYREMRFEVPDLRMPVQGWDKFSG